MSLRHFVQLCALIAFITGGCRTAPQAGGTQPSLLPTAPSPVSDSAPNVEQPTIIKAAFEEPLPTLGEAKKTDLNTQSELSLSALIEEVQRRNPSVQAMAAAWQAAVQRYPQVVSLDDPTFTAMAAPASFNSDSVESAYALQAGQKFPWFGKRDARGRMANAEASVAFHDLEDSRVRLMQATRVSFLDYYLVNRQLELNQQNAAVLRQFHNTAQSKYNANQATQQDVLQADVELAQLERRGIELNRMAKVATARINTLLREEPYTPLPAPPKMLNVPSDQLDPQALQQLALNQRPDLQALAAKIRSEQAAVTLACKDYYPDVEVFGRYDTFWQPASTQDELRGQVGVNVNVPLYKGKLNAAVNEAMFRVNQRRAEFEQRQLDIQYEVASAYEQVEESRQTLQLYTEKLVPAATQNVAAARSNYDASKMSFLDLASAQRQLIEIREKQQESLVAYYSRLAELTRVVGGAIVPTVPSELFPAPVTQ